MEHRSAPFDVLETRPRVFVRIRFLVPDVAHRNGLLPEKFLELIDVSRARRRVAVPFGPLVERVRFDHSGALCANRIPAPGIVDQVLLRDLHAIARRRWRVVPCEVKTHDYIAIVLIFSGVFKSTRNKIKKKSVYYV